MKNYIRLPLLLTSALLFIAGCTVVERLEEETIDDNQTTGQELTIWATREGEPETKTIRNAIDGAVLWVPNDAISLFYGSGTDGGSRFVSNATEATSVTNFTGTITAITGGADVSLQDTYFWGVYPYRDDVSCDGTTVTMTLPTQQKAVPGTFDTMLFPSIGRSQGLNMGFYNVCGGWRFSVTKEGVRKVTLKSNNGEIIAGKIKVGLDSAGIPFVSEIVDGSDEVVLECPRGEYFEVGKNYYFVLLPGTIASGFTMTFETYTEEGVYVRTASTKINRSGFQGVSNLDNYLSTPYHQKTGNIPVEDSNFKTYLIVNFDNNGDREISYAEAATITEINTNTNGIASVQGIEYMPSLTSLIIVGNGQGEEGGLTSLDVSNNTALRYLYCPYNQISSLDLSTNLALSSLYCFDNQLVVLNIANNTELYELDCMINHITVLDVSNKALLRSLFCSQNHISSLDLSDCNNLSTLDCQNNQLTTLDVTNCPNITKLMCSRNSITALNVSNNPILARLWCSENNLSSLVLSNSLAVVDLSCSSNQLTSLDVSDIRYLESLSCDSNLLTELDLTNNTSLKHLSCSWNQLRSLDISNKDKLMSLNCQDNQLLSLELSNNPLLVDLICGHNQITTLDLSCNSALELLWCGGNIIRTLDISYNNSLTNLICAPMPSLETLKIAQGQEIPNITINRSDDYIPAETEIVVAPANGGNEGTGDEEVTP